MFNVNVKEMFQPVCANMMLKLETPELATLNVGRSQSFTAIASNVKPRLKPGSVMLQTRKYGLTESLECLWLAQLEKHSYQQQ